MKLGYFFYFETVLFYIRMVFIFVELPFRRWRAALGIEHMIGLSFKLPGGLGIVFFRVTLSLGSVSTATITLLGHSFVNFFKRNTK